MITGSPYIDYGYREFKNIMIKLIVLCKIHIMIQSEVKLPQSISIDITI